MSVACLVLATACGGGGGGSSPAVVQTAPVITTAPVVATVAAGTDATFTVVATGAVSYQWQVSTTGVSGTFANVGAGTTGGTSDTLTVTAHTGAMNGYAYQCVITGAGSLTTTTTPVLLTVNTAPVITSAPVAITVNRGTNATFTVAATGAVSYQWQVSTTGVSGTFANVGAGTTGGTSDTLTVTAPTGAMNGYAYKCVITGAGSLTTTTTPVLLTINGAPAITTAPVAATVSAGTNATFTVAATGAVSYQWQVSTTGVSGIFANVGAGTTGGTTVTLTVTAPTLGMSGYAYQCVITGAGSLTTTTTPVLLTVDALPTITSFTVDKWSLPANGTVTFTAAFSNGTGGTAVINPGAINISSGTATATPATPTTYTLTVKNSAGTSAATSPTLRVVAGSLAVLAGNPSGFGAVDGTGDAARFSFPAGIVYDASTSHKLYVVDQGGYNNALGGAIRALTPAATVSDPAAVHTFTGLAGVQFHHDGGPAVPQTLHAGVALFNHPYGITTDGRGNFYVADTNNNSIRRIDGSGNVTTLAGATDGSAGYANIGDATYPLGRFNTPYGVAAYFPVNASNGMVYVSDNANRLIRAITVAGGSATTITDVAGALNTVGTSTTLPGTFTYPVGMCMDPAGTHIYVADAGGAQIIRALTLGSAGGTTLSSIANHAAGFANCLDVVVGPAGNLFVADSDNARVVVMNATTGATISAITGAAPGFYLPTHVASDGTNLYVADSGNNSIQVVTNPNSTPVAFRIAGSPSVLGHADASGTNATFHDPSGLAVGPVSHNIYVADRENSVIRMVTPGGTASLFAGQVVMTGMVDGGNLTIARFNHPLGVAVDALENVFVADTGNQAVRLISGGNTYTIAHFSGPLSATNAVLTPSAVAVDALDNVYVADGGSSVIVKLTPPVAGITSAGWTQSVLAGTIGIQNYHEGTGTGAQFVNPRSIVLDGAHTLYVLDAAVNNVRTVDTVTGATALFAGNTAISGLVGLTLFTPGFQDGIGNLAQFNNPMSLAIDPAAGYLFVADTNNAAVRRISIATQKVDTIIGSKAAPKLQIGGSAMSDGLPSNAVCQGIAVNGTSKQLYMAADDGILTAPY